MIAVATSWWAARVGLAVADIPRAPSPECTGHRSHWLDFEPRSLREWAMTPLALSLGLLPINAAERARVPLRTSAALVAIEGKIPAGHVYVGQGNHATRLKSTKWKCPWVVGVTCTHDEWIPLYVAHIHQNLWQDLL